eukprot:TRINITY_DN6781_c0_g1_i3.p4 TRINITY_DN6781_c0_g1~~TRINITY_DN6781_c0_g1_i3.p4  ORF type:complete len:112 (+),score=68.35 TRINITY_DN6781_c0_g1_i3:528-863(+)
MGHRMFMEKLQFQPEHIRNQQIYEIQTKTPEQQQLYFAQLAQQFQQPQAVFQPAPPAFAFAPSGPQIQVSAQSTPSFVQQQQAQQQQQQQKDQEKKNSLFAEFDILGATKR